MIPFNDITAGQPGKLTKPILFTTLANLLNILPFALIIQAIRLIFNAYSSPDAQLDINGLWMISGLLIAYMVVIFLGERLAYRACYREAYATSADGRAALAEHLRKLQLGALFSRDPGDLANMLMGDFALLEQSLSHIMPQLVGALVLPLLAVLGLSFLDWRLSLAMFAALPVAVLLMAVTVRVIRSLGSRHMRAKINAGNRLQEYLNGIRVIKAYNLTGTRFRRLEKSFRDLMVESIRLEGLAAPTVLMAVTLARAGLTFVVMAGSYLLAGGKLDPLVLVIFLIVGARVYDPLTMALVNFTELRYASQAGERIMKLREEPHMTGTKQPPQACDFQFKNVTFGYHDQPVINNLSAVIPQGSLTALVGPSGSGKSTMLKLMARFYDPDSGQVLFGGQDSKDMEPEALLKKISMVFQDVYLFQDTIENNIRFGREGATRKEVYEAAKLACCHDFIMKLPQGYDTPVGEGGCTLSGGEKQRISIARALSQGRTRGPVGRNHRVPGSGKRIRGPKGHQRIDSRPDRGGGGPPPQNHMPGRQHPGLRPGCHC